MPDIQQITTAQFGFADIYELLVKLFTHQNLENVMQHVWAFFNDAAPVLIAGVLFAFAAFFAFLGRRLIGVPIVAISVVFGYAGGAAFIAPRVNAFISGIIEGFTIDPMIIGIAVAAVFFILCLPIYFALYSLGIGYSVYLIVYNLLAVSLGDEPITMTIAGGVALGVVAVALIFRKYSEMVITSGIGGAIFIWALSYIVPLEPVVNIIIAVAVAALGFFIQFKTRRRY